MRQKEEIVEKKIKRLKNKSEIAARFQSKRVNKSGKYRDQLHIKASMTADD